MTSNAPTGSNHATEVVQLEELVTSYQAALADAGGVGEEVGAVGQRALGQLVELGCTVLSGRIRKLVFSRFGDGRGAQLVDDFFAEARVLLVEAAGNYDPGRGVPFRSWVLSTGGPVLCGLRDLLRSEAGVTSFTEGEQVVLRYANAVMTQIADSEGRYARSELFQRVRALIFERARETAARALAERKSQMSASEWEEAVGVRAQQRLRKDGILGALNRVDELLSVGWGGNLSLDAGEEGQSTLGEFVATPPEVESSDPVQLSGLRTLMTVGLSVAEKAAVAQGEDLEWLAVRMQAPHVQFAALSPTVAR